MPQAGHGLSTGAGSKMTDEDGRPKEHWREPCSASIASDFSSLAPLGLPDDALLIHCQTVSLVSNRETGKFLVTKKEKEMSRACAASFPSRSQLCAADSQAELNLEPRRAIAGELRKNKRPNNPGWGLKLPIRAVACY